MAKIESIKQYEGNTLDTIFFRPMLTGKSAEQLGIRVLYNVPGTSTLHFWRGNGDVLQKYTTRGWNGGDPSEKFQKKIDLTKVKAEMAYAAEDYFSTVYELIAARPDVNLDDLSGTELEAAETDIFRASIAESIRATMWYGNQERGEGSLGSFDGLLKKIMHDFSDTEGFHLEGYSKSEKSPEWAERLLKNLWENAPCELQALRSEGQLAYFVTTDVYNAYEECLDNVALEAAYLAKQTGRDGLYFRGIPVIDVQLNGYKNIVHDMPHSFAILTDRRNLALAVNTSDYPGTEVRMWYNPDEMENRQRAIFMAGCDYLLPELMSVGFGLPLMTPQWTLEGDTFSFLAGISVADNSVRSLEISVYDSKGALVLDSEPMQIGDGVVSYESDGVSEVATVEYNITYNSNLFIPGCWQQ